MQRLFLTVIILLIVQNFINNIFPHFYRESQFRTSYLFQQSCRSVCLSVSPTLNRSVRCLSHYELYQDVEDVSCDLVVRHFGVKYRADVPTESSLSESWKKSNN